MTVLSNFIARRYSKQALWTLFLVCAFPFHFWTLLMVFRDMDWVIARTNIGDAIGVGSYGMLFALLESVVIFLVIVLMGFFTPKQWNIDRRVAFLSLLWMIVALWGIFGQLRYLWNLSLPLPVMQLLEGTSHPFRLLYLIYLAAVLPSVLLPVYWFIKSSQSVKWMQELIERLSTLTMFYLLFDVTGLVIVIVRNLL